MNAPVLATSSWLVASGIDLFGFLDYTLRNVILGSAILGIIGGVLGTFSVLRRQSLLGDALAHAALPGICLAFILSGTKVTEVLLLGAAVTGWLGALVLTAIIRATRLREDAALGIVLSVFFGVGILLLTWIQRGQNANQSGLDRFLFGQAATLLERDVIVMGILATAALLIVAILFKEFKLVTFDPAYAASLGFPTGMLEIAITSLIVVAVLIGLQTVGVVLMVATLIAPAAAARQWTDRLGPMLVLSAGFGATAGTIGAYLSSTATRTPTGPLIVLAVTGILVVSLLFAPRRGIIWTYARRVIQRRRMAQAHLLAEIHTVLLSGGATATSSVSASPAGRADWGDVASSLSDAETSGRLASSQFTADAIAEQRFHRVSEIDRGLRGLVRRGLIRSLSNGRFSLTSSGVAESARAARNQRLWQAYLANQMELPVEDVHLDVGDLERVLPPEIIAQLETAIDREKEMEALRGNSANGATTVDSSRNTTSITGRNRTD
ncbi:MAG TPA: metal ABC transporter permease [Chloroflexota bacterium]|nr:metal ABC transporter permease [Chloroflexota bacterium]